MSACGVLCSECPAHQGAEKGPEHQARVVEAWRRIYGLEEKPEHIDCGGCLSPDNEVFHSSRTCTARLCCLSKGFKSCAECPQDVCALLERAQSVWDGVPKLAAVLSEADFAVYARPYCAHRKRLAAARTAFRAGG
jgi:hypothetical protein